jgi:hypothetical protein
MYVHPHVKISLSHSLGGLVKLHYWAVAENYIVIIVASVPLLNPLLKRGWQRYGYQYGSNEPKTSPTMDIKVQNIVIAHNETDSMSVEL